MAVSLNSPCERMQTCTGIGKIEEEGERGDGIKTFAVCLIFCRKLSGKRKTAAEAWAPSSQLLENDG